MKITLLAACLMLLFVSGGCSSSQSFSGKSMRESTLAPAKFTTKAGVNFGESACKSPLVDPTDGIEITLVESVKGVGDYEVPSGKYGMKANELLRINCQTGEVLGIVKK